MTGTTEQPANLAPPGGMTPATPPAELQLYVPPTAGLSNEYVGAFRGMATTAKMSREQAQAALDFNLARNVAGLQALEAERAAERAAWDAQLVKDFPGEKLADTDKAIAAFLKTRAPQLHERLIEKGAHRDPPIFHFLAGLAAAAGETGGVRPAVAPAVAAAVDPDDYSAIFDHPTSKAAMAEHAAAAAAR